MAGLNLDLFGGFELQQAGPNGGAVTLSAKKARGLLAYLAVSGRPQSRDKLAALLWDESAESQARTSLRQALAAVRKVGDGAVLAADESLALDDAAVVTDVGRFAALLAENTPAALEDAVALYRGDLLDGFHIGGHAFQDWLGVERQRLREQAVTAMTRLLDHHAEAGNNESAVRLATRLISLDPLREDVHRRLMQLYARQGRPAAALKQYRTCRELLRRELAVAPEPETDALYRQIGQRRSSSEDAKEDESAGTVDDTLPEAAPTPEITFGFTMDDSLASPWVVEDPNLAAFEAAPVSTELRYVTVLFADLSGFTELSAELDPEDLRSLLQRFLGLADTAIERHGGHIDKHIGDSTMAIFGAHRAHGDEAERALNAAFSIHAELTELDPATAGRTSQPLKAHIGIASGRVLADGESVTGECVNLAARLTDLAGPGQTVVADSLRRALAGRLEANEINATKLKGFGTPKRLWQALGLAAADGRPFVGRAAELQQLAALAQVAAAGEQGFTVHVRGDPGIGKTRLIEGAMAQARGQGFDCHLMPIREFGSGLGPGPTRLLAQSLLGLADDADLEERRRAAELALAEGLIEPAQRLHLNDLLRLPQPPDLAALLAAMDFGTRNRQGVACVRALVAALASRRPLFIVVENLHWADSRTLAHFAQAAVAVRQVAALLVLTSRSDADPLDQNWRLAAQGAALTTIDLGPLSEAEGRELAGHNAVDDEAVIAACIARAEGNPLFLDQLLLAADQPGGSAESVPESVPDSVEAIVQARLDRLGEHDRRAAQLAAGLGGRFSLEPLRQLLGDAEYGPEALLDCALIRPQGNDYLFAHNLVQHSVYASLTRSRRLALHRDAAAWYQNRDPLLHAEHLERAGEGAAPAYLEAARALAADYRFERAFELAERGRALATQPAEHHELACLSGELLRDLARIDDSITAFESALAAAADDEQRCRAWLGMVSGQRLADRYDEALEVLARAQPVVMALGEAQAQVMAEFHILRGSIHFSLGHESACLADHETACVAARRAGLPGLEARALSGLGDAYYQRGRMITAQGHFDHCVRVARDHGETRIEVANLCMRGVTSFYLHDAAAAIADCQSAAEVAARIGDRRSEMLARNVLVTILPYLGRGEEALDHARRSHATAKALGSRLFAADGAWLGAFVAYLVGRGKDTEERLQRAWQVVEEVGPQFSGAWLQGAIAVVTRDPARRQAAIATGERLLQAGSLSHNHLHFRQLAMDALLAAGDWESAEAQAAALEAYSDEPLPWSRFHVARGRLLAEMGRGQGGVDNQAQLAELKQEAAQVGYAKTLFPATIVGSGN